MFYWIVSGPSVVHPDMDIAILPRTPDEWRFHISNCLGVLFFYLSLGCLVDGCVSRSLHREGIHSIVYLTDGSLRINLTSRYCYLLCHQLKRCFDFVSLKYLISRNFRRNPSKCFQITEHWMDCPFDMFLVQLSRIVSPSFLHRQPSFFVCDIGGVAVNAQILIHDQSIAVAVFGCVCHIRAKFALRIPFGFSIN